MKHSTSMVTLLMMVPSIVQAARIKRAKGSAEMQLHKEAVDTPTAWDAPCNPSKCEKGLECKSNPGVCCEAGDFGCCGTGSQRNQNRLYCPWNYDKIGDPADSTHFGGLTMCSDGACVPNPAWCNYKLPGKSVRTLNIRYAAQTCQAPYYIKDHQGSYYYIDGGGYFMTGNSSRKDLFQDENGGIRVHTGPYANHYMYAGGMYGYIRGNAWWPSTVEWAPGQEMKFGGYQVDVHEGAYYSSSYWQTKQDFKFGKENGCSPELQTKSGKCLSCMEPDVCFTCDFSNEVVDGKCVCKPSKGFGCTVCADGLANNCKECHKGYTNWNGMCISDTLHEDGACSPAPPTSFYTYRAVNGDENYKPNGINTASSGGVMRYIHEEVVGVDCCATQCTRKYGIDRIKRFKITMHSTGDPRHFENFVQFDKAQCTLPGCVEKYKTEGYNVGCQVQHVQNFGYHDSAWFSWPGTCPSRPFWDKSDACKKDEPGGECDKPNGDKNCTYKMEDAGFVYLDELVGLPGKGHDLYKDWCEKGGVEFILHPDMGVWKGKEPTYFFWKDRWNAEENSLRTKRMLMMFRQKYPKSPILQGTGPGH